ncbi:MAG: tetratricopeptide repeat protein [Elusimicrobia bacterium]|nr:tetratricopeptide repeat protein [Elusimicrobiota bacterium]
MRLTIRNHLLVACFFVCPLLFFTNLTRNPYVTQICLINIFLCACAGVQFLWDAGVSGRLRLPRTALDAPFAAAAAACAVSWLVAFVGHAPFFRSAMLSEGARNTVFAIVNILLPFYLAAALGREEAEAQASPAGGPPLPAAPGAASKGRPGSPGAGGKPRAGNRDALWEAYPTAAWAVFALAWGGLWVLFPQMRTLRASSGLWSQAWDGYGAVVWAAGIAAAAWLTRAGRMLDYLHLALVAGFLASVYGVLQYFNVEFLWPSILNPYGGRSVSTFGNPNFLSSFNVVLLPIAVTFYLYARDWTRRAIYGAVCLALGSALLASLTRSSWGGAVAAVALLFLLRETRARAVENSRAAGLLAGLALMIILLWPQTRVGGAYHPSVLGRITEIKSFSAADGYYSPFHQRVLIWTSSWLMGAENPVTGKGWGLFELFYPFYQGHLLDTFQFFRNMRTHANNSHNEIMEVWSQTGIMGLGILLWLWCAFFLAAKRRLSEPPGVREWTAFASACGVAGMLADNMLNVSLHFAMPAFMFWWAAGTAMGPVHGADRPWYELSRSAAAKAAALAGAALLAVLSWYWVCTWFREAHYFAGFKLLRQGQLAAAVKSLETSKAWGPREVNAIYELGNAYARMERFKDADAAYADAMRANAGYDEIYFNIATVKASRLGQPEQALSYFRSALAINPISSDAHAAMTALLLQDPQRHLEEARRALARAVAMFPRNPNNWNNMGYVMSLGKRWAEAEQAYVKALEINPDMRISETNLRSVLKQSGRPAPPIIQTLDLLRELERRLAASDHSEAALALAARVADSLPTVPRARFFLGTLLLARGRFEEAVGHLEWVAAREPTLVGARLNLARAYIRLSRPNDAARELKAVLAMDPQNADARMGLKAMGMSQ